MTCMVDTPDPREFTALRGATAPRIDVRFWRLAGATLLAVFAVIVIVSFLSASNDNSRIERMKNHGISVAVTVTNCAGNIGGSGSNAAGYTCQGSYQVDGVRYVETIGSMTTMAIAGTKVRAVADPQRPSTVELAATVVRSSPSSSVYVVPSLMALLAIVLSLLFIRRQLHHHKLTLGSK
jgi:hypothetical protein